VAVVAVVVNGRIAGIPYVLTTANGARLTTRYEVRKHLG
jgi:hypothetical protein